VNHFSEITVGESPSVKKSGKYRIRGTILLDQGNEYEETRDGFGTFIYDFDYDAQYSTPFLLFIELTGQCAQVLLRLGNSAGDRKSYDMLLLFKGIKETVVKERMIYKKRLFQDDFECFDGFFPFGFTLVQPALNSFLGIGTFSYGYHGFASRDLLSFRIFQYRFHTLTIYGDIVAKSALFRRSFRRSIQIAESD
jgi:hypothetical protein